MENVVFGTKHKKDLIVTPIFFDILNWKVTAVEFDTDSFGTFSGEVPRIGTPLDCAVGKAREALRITGAKKAIASEGSIGPDPRMPLTIANIETMVYLDLELNLQIVETIISNDIFACKVELNSIDEYKSKLSDLDLANHSVIVRSISEPFNFLEKGINNQLNLKAAVTKCKKLNSEEAVVIESDFRAMHSLSRRRNIALCAQKLAQRIKNVCDSCGSPGWGLVGYSKGLPCEVCGLINESAVRADQFGCQKCDKIQIINRDLTSISAKYCNFCNP